ncbi:MAG: NnrS family protein [Rhodospirillales bacterium]|nr:NnrS family protein [Rhodospirillales bacterium]
MAGSAAVQTPRGAAVLAYGFRPFFLLAGLYGAISVPLWAVAFLYGFEFPGTVASPRWHGHEMLFGFAGAAVAGFLLTVVPSWTDTPPLTGGKLLLVVLVWLAGRLVNWMGAVLPLEAVAAIDLLFLPVLMAVVAAPVLASGQRRNFLVVGLLALMLVANLMFHAEAVGSTGDTASLGLRLMVYALVMMIVIITGRIVPMFTTNAMARRGLDLEARTASAVQKAVLICVPVAAVADIVGAPAMLNGVLALVAGLALALRMGAWHSFKTLGQPILWVIHLGHAWLPIAFFCKAAADFTDLFPADAALHAFTGGAIATSILAVMSRASLGHTGREILAPTMVAASYVCITAAALLRVFGTAFAGVYMESMILSSLLWTAGFGLFCLHFAPVLLSPRADGKPG